MCLAVPGKLVSIDEGSDPLLRSGKVSFGGAIKEVNLAYLPEAAVGDYVIVHVGFAITRLDEEDAQETLRLLREMGSVEEELGGEGAKGPGTETSS